MRTDTEGDTPVTDALREVIIGQYKEDELTGNGMGNILAALTDIETLERERDAALIGYNECRATIEDARVALNAHEYEGLLLASLRIQDQLTSERALADRLAEELEKIAWLAGHEVPNEAEKALAAWKEARSERR